MGADTLAFVSIEGLYRAMGLKKRNSETPQYCDACFTGEYPVSLIDRDGGQTTPQLSFLSNLS